MLPGDCNHAVEACCQRFYDLAKCFVDASVTKLRECVGNTCGEISGYVSHARPQGPGNYIAGWLNQMTPAPARQSTPGAKQLFVPKMLGAINIALVESNFPTPGYVGGKITRIKPADLDYAAMHSYSHAEVVTRAIANNLQSACVGGCESVQIVQMQPLVPAADHVAWEWSLLATINLSKIPAPA